MKQFTFLNSPVLQDLPSETTEGSRFYAIPSGEKVPSITTVLSHFSKKSLEQWRNRIGHAEAAKQTRQAANYGTLVHNSIERILKNDPEVMQEAQNNPLLYQALLDLKPRLEMIDNIRYMETPLYSPRLKIAGRVDLIAELSGVPSIIDFKTSTKRKQTKWITNYFEQATAYSLMLEELTGIEIPFIAIMMVSPEGPQMWLKRRHRYVPSLEEKIKTYYLDVLNNVV